MKKSFKDENRTDEAVAADEQALMDVEGYEEETGLVRASDTSMALTLGKVEGDIDERDLVIPYFKIVHGTSDMSGTHGLGSMVLGKDTVLATAGNPINLTVLMIEKYFIEWPVKFVKGQRRTTWKTREAMHADGVWVEWKNDERPPAREAARVTMLIKKPDDLESLSFCKEYGGAKYALGIWLCEGTAYTRAAKKIFSANSIELAAKGLVYGSWTMHVEQQECNGNQVYVPVLQLDKEPNSEAFISDISADLGRTQSNG